MKKIILLMALSLFHLVAGSPPESVLYIEHSEGVNPFLHLWEAVIEVEAGGDPYAVNIREQAYGIAQIRQVRLDDYADRTGIRYTLEDCYDKKISKSIFMYYAGEIGICSPERIIREWNGGPRGMQKRSTIKYYLQVRRAMSART